MSAEAADDAGPSGVSVLLATPPGFNPGMVATELALSAFLRRHGIMEGTRFYRMTPISQRLARLPAEAAAAVERRCASGIEYRSAIEQHEAFLGGRSLLFWADFQHMAQYIRALERMDPADDGQRAGQSGLSWAKRLFLLAEADEEVLRRTLSFGTTLLFNTHADEAASAYGLALRRLLNGARRVWVRDALSAARVAHLRRDYRTGHFGVDAALLLRREDVGAPPAPDADPAGGVLVFCGRDAVTRAPMLQLAAQMGAVLRRPLGWLPWGDALAFPNIGAPDIGSMSVPAVLPDTANTLDLLKELARAALVVTDTYHLALMAWSFGIPAIAAFPGHSRSPSDVSSGTEFQWRDKREVFFSQYDALDFLVRPEELRDPDLLERRSRRLAQGVQDQALHRAITANLRAHAAAVEADLACELRTLAFP